VRARLAGKGAVIQTSLASSAAAAAPTGVLREAKPLG